MELFTQFLSDPSLQHPTNIFGIGVRVEQDMDVIGSARACMENPFAAFTNQMYYGFHRNHLPGIEPNRIELQTQRFELPSVSVVVNDWLSVIVMSAIDGPARITVQACPICPPRNVKREGFGVHDCSSENG